MPNNLDIETAIVNSVLTGQRSQAIEQFLSLKKAARISFLRGLGKDIFTGEETFADKALAHSILQILIPAIY